MKRVAALLLCALLSIAVGRADDWEGNLTFSTEDVAAFEACMQSVRSAWWSTCANGIAPRS